MGVLIAGFGMIALTLAIHTLGASQWLKFAARRHRNAAEEKRLSNLFYILLYTASVLMLLHLLEAFLWAFLFLQLPGQAGLSNVFMMRAPIAVGYRAATGRCCAQ